MPSVESDAEHPFRDLTTCCPVCSLYGAAGRQRDKQRITYMRKAILGAASALALASPAVAADLPVAPYSEVPGYEGAYTYGYGTAPPVVIEEPPAAVVVRPPVVVAPPVVVEDYPVYAAPRAYAYGDPFWHGGWRWSRRHHFHDGW